MWVEARKTLVWGTAAAAVASAMWLALTGGGMPRIGADAAARARVAPTQHQHPMIGGGTTAGSAGSAR